MGRGPFGYRTSEGRLVPDPEQAPLVREAFRRCAHDHQPLADIARWLTEVAGSSSRGGRWRTADVKRLLTCPAYAGRMPPQADPGQALVGEETWRQTQQVLAARARYGRARESRYLLSGLLRCRNCGAAMTGHRHRRASAGGRREIVNYNCSRKASRSRGCRGSYISAPKAHQLVAAQVRALSLAASRGDGPRFLPRGEAHDEVSAAQLRRRLAGYPQQLARLLQQYKQGRLSPTQYARARRRMEEERQRIQQSLRRAAAPPSPSEEQAAVSGLADILESDRFGRQLKKDLLREAFDRIIIERDGTVRLWVRL